MNNHHKNDQASWHIAFTLAFLLLFALFTSIFNTQGSLTHDIPILDFIVLILATFRLIRLFTYDIVTHYLRKYFSQFESGPGKTTYQLLNCPWCVGIWAALAVYFLYFISPYTWYLLLILAISGAASSIQITIWKVGVENNN